MTVRSRSAACSRDSATTASRGSKAAAYLRAYGTYLHGPLLPRNPWFADRVLADALAHRSGGEPPDLAPLDDELERAAHDVSAARARARGGRF